MTTKTATTYKPVHKVVWIGPGRDDRADTYRCKQTRRSIPWTHGTGTVNCADCGAKVTFCQPYCRDESHHHGG